MAEEMVFWRNGRLERWQNVTGAMDMGIGRAMVGGELCEED